MIVPMAVVGQQFCAPFVVELTVTKKILSLTHRNFAVTDGNGNLVLKVNGILFSVRERCVLLDAADNPPLTMQQKMFSMHRRWRVFKGDSKDPKDLLFSVKKSRMLQAEPELDVFMAGNTNEDAHDFKIKGSYSKASCTIYLGDSSCIIAQMNRKYSVKSVILGKDSFSVTVIPNVDFAVVAALTVLLCQID